MISIPTKDFVDAALCLILFWLKKHLQTSKVMVDFILIVGQTRFWVFLMTCEKASDLLLRILNLYTVYIQ